MKIKELKKELEKVQSEAQKKEIISNYAEQKTVGCGRWLIFIFLILVIITVLFGLIALLKLIFWFIF